MINFDLSSMLFVIPKDKHEINVIKETLQAHPEVKFVSLVGIDNGGHDTDEKIPVELFLSDMKRIIKKGVQTDGSSVALPLIAELNNAKVDIIPDVEAHWYVDYNYEHMDMALGLPVGTLRIPSILVHNENFECGSRVVLRDAIKNFEKILMEKLRENPYVFQYIRGIDSVEEIESVGFTCATELEFWVKTPDDIADKEQLSTAQVLKEQYWKRTIGPVRTALEETLILLDKYGFEVEMGHKEVGGVKAKLGHSGQYDHIMEQLEIDWKYTDAMQAADNEKQIKYIVKDIFTRHGLEVTFLAKPIEGVAGSGKHTHLGVVAKLKNGNKVNLFAPADESKDFMSPIGFGGLMGLLKNYEVVNPFVSATNDAFNRLKPGYEAPVCIVTSLGRSVEENSRNRTVLAGLIRDIKNPAATRFELRSPNPKSNTYLVVATAYLAILDGIVAALENSKSPKDLEKSISKKYGEKDFYLETNREYRSEEDVFEFYTAEERNKIFGKAPATVYENIKAFDDYKEKLNIFTRDDILPLIVLNSYRAQTLSLWSMELLNRIIPEYMDEIRNCKKLHHDDASDYDLKKWDEIAQIREKMGKNTLSYTCMLTQAMRALEEGNFEEASKIQLELQTMMSSLSKVYAEYKKNLF